MMTVGTRSCVSPGEVRQSAKNAGFSAERQKELVGAFRQRMVAARGERARAGLRALDQEAAEARAAWEPLLRRISETPARSYAGLAVKLYQQRRLLRTDGLCPRDGALGARQCATHGARQAIGRPAARRDRKPRFGGAFLVRRLSEARRPSGRRSPCVGCEFPLAPGNFAVTLGCTKSDGCPCRCGRNSSPLPRAADAPRGQRWRPYFTEHAPRPDPPRGGFSPVRRF